MKQNAIADYLTQVSDSMTATEEVARSLAAEIAAGKTSADAVVPALLTLAAALDALAASLAETLTHHRTVHPDDRHKADLGAVLALLARDLAELRDQLEKAL